MSVYSYASHQPIRQPSESNTPPTERRRHRSGGAVQRLDSGDLLELVDRDIIPPVSILFMHSLCFGFTLKHIQWTSEGVVCKERASLDSRMPWKTVKLQRAWSLNKHATTGFKT